MNTKHRVAIVIPVFKTTFSESEMLSIACWKKYLSSYDTFAVSPENIQIHMSKWKKKTFPRRFFSSIHTYSQLLLSDSFYEAFAAYEYILIYQLDALVFSNSLPEWVAKGYDYVGAPWERSIIGFPTHPKGRFHTGGNGGLSLRRVATMRRVLRQVDMEATRKSHRRIDAWMWFFVSLLLGKTRTKWLAAPASSYPFNEDGFWSFEAEKYIPEFKTPSYKEALSFAIETNPRKNLSELSGNLPFGCHAFGRYDKRAWMQVVRKLGLFHVPADRLSQSGIKRHL